MNSLPMQHGTDLTADYADYTDKQKASGQPLALLSVLNIRAIREIPG
jgi:hypothetical protein